jgi:hypothetical protein
MAFVKKIALVFVAALSFAAPVSAEQDVGTRVIVPDAPGGARFSGCYRADEDLYGPYRLTFCLRRQGTYSIRGGGLRCEGTLNWDVSGRDINVRIHRTACGNGVAWARARMTCRGTTLLKGTIGRIISQVLVPELSGLRCAYDPSVSGHKNRTFNAHRV